VAGSRGEPQRRPQNPLEEIQVEVMSAGRVGEVIRFVLLPLS
jgi:hypothetical protein